MKKLLFGALLASALSWPLGAKAQQQMPDLTKPVTLDQALQVAFCQSPDIKIALAQIQRSNAGVDVAKSGYLPKFNADLVQQWQGPAVSVPAGALGPGQTEPVNITEPSNTTASASMTLPLDINRRIGYTNEIAKLTNEIDYLNLRSVSQQLIFNVKNAFYNVLRAIGQQEVAQSSVDVANGRLREAQARFNAGSAPKFDVTSAQVDVANLNQQLIAATSRVAVARTALNRVLGVDVNSPTEVVRSEVVVDNVKVDIPKSIEQGNSLRPEVLSVQRSIALNKTNAKLQRTGILPSLGASGQVNYNVKASGFSSQNTSWTALLDLKIPIWDAGQTKAQVAQAYADVNKSIEQLAQTKLGVGTEVRTAALTLQEAIERVSTTAENVSLAQESLRLANVRYAAGISTTVEVQNAESALTQAQFNAVNARYDYATALADYQRSTSTQPEVARLQLLCPQSTNPESLRGLKAE